MSLQKSSPCKVNLVLNILGRRDDGFHELETLMHPVPWHDELTFQNTKQGIELSCSDAELPTDSRNLVHRAATLFFSTSAITAGVKIHLEKRIPAAAGLGGGSGNAALTLLGLNELFGEPLSLHQLTELAAKLGSDVPFFLQENPALATGRGEAIEPLAPFPALQGRAFLLARPGFGVSTAWAYQALAQYPQALQGIPGRAAALADLLQKPLFNEATKHAFYNSLEAPVLEKYPLLALLKNYLLKQGSLVALMSGSGSTVFAIASDLSEAKRLEKKVQETFAPLWTCVAQIGT